MLEVTVYAANLCIQKCMHEHDLIVIKCSEPKMCDPFLCTVFVPNFLPSINAEQVTLETTVEICTCPEVESLYILFDPS